MRSLSLIVIGLLAGAFLAQAQTFNIVHHNQNFLPAQGRSVFEQEDGFLVFNVQFAWDSSASILFATKFDLEGDLVYEIPHPRPRSMDPGIIDPIAEHQQGGYAAVVSLFSGTEPNQAYFYRFDVAGDTLFTKFIKEDTLPDNNSGSRQLIQLNDGGYLHCGWCAVEGYGACITRLDSTGEILWEKVYDHGPYIFSATPLSDGGFLLGSGRNQWPDRGVIIKVDSLGEQQWIRYYGGHAVTGGRKVLELEDGSMLFPGAWETTSAPTWGYNRNASLYKYAANGTFLWRKDLYYGYQALLGFIERASDDLLWAVGGIREFDGGPKYHTRLMKLTEEGDSLWMREYWHYFSDISDNAIYAATPTSDGGLVMTGLTRQGPNDPQPNLASCWILKVDEYGCVEPGCQLVGVREYAADLDQYFNVWPNPLPQHAPINFSFEPPNGFEPTGDLRAVLLDAMGREVISEVYAAGTSKFMLAPGRLSSGIYHLHLTDKKSWLAGAKVVVE